MGFLAGRVVAQAEGVGDAPDPAGRVHHQNIEAHAIGAPIRVRAEDDLARANQPELLSWCERGGCLGQSRSGFHLDDRKKARLLSNGIHLAGRGTQAAGEDGPAVGDKGGAGGVLGSDTCRVGGPASMSACVHPGSMTGMC
jgi:hypothetical protein